MSTGLGYPRRIRHTDLLVTPTKWEIHLARAVGKGRAALMRVTELSAEFGEGRRVHNLLFAPEREVLIKAMSMGRRSPTFAR